VFDRYYYRYEIRVFDEVGYNSTAAPKLTKLIQPTGDITPPNNIMSLAASSLGTGGNVRLSWTAPPDKDVMYYKLYRSRTASFTPSPANLIGTTINTYYNDYDPTLNGTGVMYYYKVRAADENNNTATGGNEASIAVYDQQRPISVSTFTAISGTDGKIILSWTASTPPDFQSYNIYRSLNPNFIPSSSTLIVKIRLNTTLNYIDNESNLIDGQVYTYKIAVADEVGDSPTQWAYCSTGGDDEAPRAPTGLSVSNEGTGDILNITWNKNSEKDVHHYKIYRNSTTQSWTWIADSTSNFYQDSLLIEYQRYFYFITAADEEYNEGNASAIRSGIPIDIKPPGAPTIMTISRVGRVGLILIQPPTTDKDVLYYNIYRSNVSGFIPSITTLIAANYSSGGPFTIYPDGPLSLGIYYYVVFAVDDKFLVSPLPSNERSLNIPLLAPVWISIQDNGNGDLTLTWADNSSIPVSDLPFIVGYYIYRMNSSATIPIFFANITSHSTQTHKDSGVPNGLWSYFITTIDSLGGESSYSIARNITILDRGAPGAPTGLINVTAAGLVDVTISWICPTNPNNGSDVIRYEIYIATNPITNITGLLPNATIYGFGWFPNSTIFYPATMYSFYNLADNTYYFIVLAYDENNYASPFSNMLTYIVDTTKPTIDNTTIRYPTEIRVGGSVNVTITIYDRNTIGRVYIIYIVDTKPSAPLEMTLLFDYGNGSRIYIATISAAVAAGKTVSFTITAVDAYGNTMTSSPFAYKVTSEVTPWTLIIVAIGAIAVGAIAGTVVITRMRAKGKKKEYVAEELLPLPI
jgi:hypothetical protein